MHTRSYLPIAVAYCRMLNLRESVDGMVETRMVLSPGMVVQEIDLNLFNETTIDRSLNALFSAGPSKDQPCD